MALEIFDSFPQGDPQWFEVRKGIPTASEFQSILAKAKDGSASGKMRTGYMQRLAAERLTGIVEPTYQSADMEYGKEHEDEARKHYALMRGREIRQIAFAREPGVWGCSPDSLLVGLPGGLEIKVPKVKTLIRMKEEGVLPSEYVAQVQGTMAVLSLEFMDFYAYNPRLPQAAFHLTIARDPTYIVDLKKKVEAFNVELNALVAKYQP